MKRRAVSVAVAFFLGSGVALAQGIFLQARSSASGRYAVLEDDGKTAFLYLTEPGIPKPVKDAVAYSRVAPVSKVDWERIKSTGATPQLAADIASRSAVIASPKPSEFQFKWSIDGNSVAVLRNGSPLAMASTADKLGYSKAVAKSSSLANVWSETRYLELFGR